jgi:SOS-response transcriptional repressor LexA
MISLTPKQQACLDAIARHRAVTGVMPTVEELRVALAIASKGTVFLLLKSLEKRRAIRRQRGLARAITLLTDRCPHCGEPLHAPRQEASAT